MMRSRGRRSRGWISRRRLRCGCVEDLRASDPLQVETGCGRARMRRRGRRGFRMRRWRWPKRSRLVCGATRGQSKRRRARLERQRAKLHGGTAHRGKMRLNSAVLGMRIAGRQTVSPAQFAASNVESAKEDGCRTAILESRKLPLTSRSIAGMRETRKSVR